MSLQAQIELLNKLGTLGEPIPGLDVDKIVENLAKKSEEIKTINESIDSEEDEEEERVIRAEDKKKSEEERKEERKRKKEERKKKREAEKKKMMENYKKEMRKVVTENTIEIKQNYKIFKDAILSIPPDVSSLIANILLPPAIAVPPAAPNPLYALNLTKQSKNTLVRTLNNAIVAFSVVLKLSIAIKFEIPKIILDLFDQISVASNLIASIPI